MFSIKDDKSIHLTRGDGYYTGTSYGTPSKNL